MDYVLPTEFDLIVIGTGLIESTVSAAASRIGKRVLHIDRKNYYGGIWASFNLEAIQKIAEKPESVKSNVEVQLENGERLVPVGNQLFDIKDVVQHWHIPSESSNNEDVLPDGELNVISSCENEPISDSAAGGDGVKIDENKTEEPKLEWTQKELLDKSRKFNIDLAPKINFSRGEFVELLISSNIARYSEFRSISRILTYINGELQTVPSSRSDIFANSKVSVIDKRMLMKLLTTCMSSSEKDFEGYENKTFKEYLKKHKLNADLIHYILYAIAMSNDETPCLEGVARTKRFLTSLGRFGKTPFLYSMYGSGEIPQAFCRMSAVFGGIYALNQPLGDLIYDEENKFKGLITGNQKITADYVVMSMENAPLECIETLKPEFISRGIFIIDRSMIEAPQENLTLMLFPSVDGQKLCYIVEAGSLTGTCPKGVCLLYMFTKQSKDPESDLKFYVDKLLTTESNSEKPKILWSFYYSAPTVNMEVDNKLTNTFLCPGPDLDLDYDESIKRARIIFEKIYPGEELLPRAPDPEEIIIGDEDEQPNNDTELNQSIESNFEEVGEEKNLD